MTSSYLSFGLLSILSPVGNHDFDQGGIDNLRDKVSLAPNMTLVCANIVDASSKCAFAPYKILKAGNIKIAIVGLLGEGNPMLWF